VLLGRFLQQINGTWILERRTNADGSEHAKPIKGETKIQLAVQPSTLFGSIATGTITAKESGILDARWGVTVPAESRDQPFQTESSGSWQVYVDPEEKDPDVVTVVDNSMVRANYRPFQQGLRGEAVSKFRVNLTPAKTKQKRAVGQGPVSTAVQLVSPSVSRTIAVTMSGRPIAEEEMRAVAMCSCQGLTIGGDVMEIVWSNGAKDVWKRTSSKI